MFKVPEKYRLTVGPMRSNESYGNNGIFQFMNKTRSIKLNVLASDGMKWEHVSVSTPERAPTWDEMQFVKERFWSDNDAVIQIHPIRDEYINCHKNCLHMWRLCGTNDFFKKPPSILVGPKRAGLMLTSC